MPPVRLILFTTTMAACRETPADEAGGEASSGASETGVASTSNVISDDTGQADTSDDGSDAEADTGEELACPHPTSPPVDDPLGLVPYEAHCFEVPAGRMAYVDEGTGSSGETILLVHGNPTWSALYRSVIGPLVADGHRVIAPDLLGYGRSERVPADAFGYGPRAQAEQLEAFVLGMDLQGVTLVVQDWGGPIGLWVAGRNPERIARVQVMNTWAWPVSADAPGTDHRLVDWSTLAAAQEGDWSQDCAMPRRSATRIADSVDPTGGELHQAVVRLYLDRFVDPATDEPWSALACIPTMALATGILEEADFLAEVEAGLAMLKGLPVTLVSGRGDALFGDLRCDVVAGVGVCPGGHTCECEPDYLDEGTSCGASAPSNPTAWVCRDDVTDRFAMAAIDRFVAELGAQNIVDVVTIKTSEHFLQEAVPDSVVHGVRTLIAGAPQDTGMPYAYGPENPSSAGGFCDQGGETSYWPEAPADAPIVMLDAVWLADGRYDEYLEYGDAVAPLAQDIVEGMPLDGPASWALARAPNVVWNCKGGVDPARLVQLDADAFNFVQYSSQADFDAMYYSPEYRAIAELRCDNVERALLIPCAVAR